MLGTATEGLATDFGAGAGPCCEGGGERVAEVGTHHSLAKALTGIDIIMVAASTYMRKKCRTAF